MVLDLLYFSFQTERSHTGILMHIDTNGPMEQAFGVEHLKYFVSERRAVFSSVRTIMY